MSALLIASGAAFADNARNSKFTIRNRNLSPIKMFQRCPIAERRPRGLQPTCSRQTNRLQQGMLRVQERAWEE
jgi:hypothetical protein